MASSYDISVTFKAVDQLTAPIKRMSSNVTRFTAKMENDIQQVSKATQGLRTSFAKVARTSLRLGSIIGGVLGAGLLFATRQFAKIEDAEAAFRPMLGSLEAAQKAVRELNDLAVVTPFRFEHLAGAARIMLSSGSVGGDDLVDTMRMLGDVSAGNADQLNRIALVYSQVLGLGKANTRDLNQFVDAGVPIIKLLEELPELAGKSSAEIRSMAAAGQLTSDMFTKALRAATKEGGMFFRAMDFASMTTTGLWNQLVNNVQLVGASFGKAINEPLKEILIDLNLFAQDLRRYFSQPEVIEEMSKKFREFTDWLRSAAIFLKENGKQILKFIGVLTALMITFKILTAVLFTFNMIALAGPFGLMAAGIGALIVAVTALWAWWDDLNEGVKIFIITTTSLTAAIGAVVLAMKAWGAAIVAWTAIKKTLIGTMLVFNAVAYANPFVLIAGAIAITVAALVAMVVWWDELTAKFAKMPLWGKIITIAIVGPLMAVAFIIRKIIDGITWLGQKLGLLEAPKLDIEVGEPKIPETIEPVNAANPFNVGGAMGSTFANPFTMTTPQDRTSESISKEIEEKTSNVNIRVQDDSGRADVETSGDPFNGMLLYRSGAFG